ASNHDETVTPIMTLGVPAARGFGGTGAIRAGGLTVMGGRALSAEEAAIANKLVGEGRTVIALAELNVAGVRSADFMVDFVKTELKTVSRLTGKELSAGLSRRILEGAGQASNIIADVRLQAGMTRAEAVRAVYRVFGADKVLRRIRSVRLIGADFDV